MADAAPLSTAGKSLTIEARSSRNCAYSRRINRDQYTTEAGWQTAINDCIREVRDELFPALELTFFFYLYPTGTPYLQIAMYTVDEHRLLNTMAVAV